MKATLNNLLARLMYCPDCDEYVSAIPGESCPECGCTDLYN